MIGQALDPNVQGYPGPGDIDALTESFSIDFTALLQTFGNVFTMPQGYSRLLCIEFDPTVGVLIDLKTQRAKQDILFGYNTKGVNNGIKYLGTKDLENDVLNYKATLVSQGNTVAAIAGPVIFPANPLPIKFTITLTYGR